MSRPKMGLAMDKITLKEACELLGVSRPTLNSYREKYRLSEVFFGGKIRLSKTEIIERIILQDEILVKDSNLTIHSDSDISQIQPLGGVYDLRRLRAIDAFGVLELLCSIKAIILHSVITCTKLDSSPKLTAHMWDEFPAMTPQFKNIRLHTAQ